MVSALIFFVPEGRKNFPFQKTFPKSTKSFLELRKGLLLFQKLFGFGKSCDYHWGFTIGVAVLACGSME